MENQKPRRRWKKKLIYALLAFLCIWIAGDFIYSRVVAYRVSKWEANVVRDSNGVTLDCCEYSAGDGSTAILFLHGINDTPYGYREIVPEFVSAGYHCRVMRMPGFGEETRAYARSTRHQWLEQLNLELEQLSQNHQQIFLIAHSLGAAVTINYLLNHQSNLAGLILLAPGIEVSNYRSPVLSARAWHEFGKWTLMFTQITETPYKNDTLDPELREFPQRIRFIGRSTADETFRLIDENRGRASEIDLPLLIVIGTHDHVIDNKAAKQFFLEASSEKKEFLELENSAHAMQVDYDWRKLTDHILQFIREVESNKTD